MEPTLVDSEDSNTRFDWHMRSPSTKVKDKRDMNWFFTRMSSPSWSALCCHMSTCWRTVNNCNSTVCGIHGACVSEMGHMWCDCKWGYTGDHCEEALEKK
ncbi:hypothetical protein L3Y34_017111 [Caenorhabditis briggsae]|uniref:EGF-like domain-containing protein n=1 Tax=Caenorhabditis briggsae TaxID=6238 RepID=A0AAE9ISZ7_CAEBR|nr:hypothetical protein L3Y34_017111 [Caenorhabditis briggsae]